MSLTTTDLTSLVKQLCACKAKNTGAAGTGGGGAGRTLTYNTMRFTSQDSGASIVLRGQRDPAARYELLSVDFVNKTVLDLGSNAGGMIFGVAEVVRQAVGVDFDPALTQLGNEIVAMLGWSQQEVSFHGFDFNSRTRLDTLLTLAQDKTQRFDIITMYSLNMWIRDPERIILWAQEHANIFIMETNGADRVQQQSISVLRRACRKLVEKTDYERCPDCYLNPSDKFAPRRLFVCKTDPTRPHKPQVLSRQAVAKLSNELAISFPRPESFTDLEARHASVLQAGRFSSINAMNGGALFEQGGTFVKVINFTRPQFHGQPAKYSFDIEFVALSRLSQLDDSFDCRSHFPLLLSADVSRSILVTRKLSAVALHHAQQHGANITGIELAVQVRHILTALHCAGIEHLDFTCRNLMWNEQVRGLVLLDFDLVRIFPQPSSSTCRITATGTTWVRPAQVENCFRKPPNHGGADDAVKMILRDCLTTAGAGVEQGRCELETA